VLQLLLAHIAAALVAPALMRLMGRRGFLVLAAAPAATAIWALAQTPAVLAGNGPMVSLDWMPAIGMNLDFRLDVLSWFMTVIVGGVGTFVLFYCSWYFATGAKYLGRFAAVFVGFAGAMLGLVTTDNTLVLYVFWELTTVFSYLLVGHYFDRKGARRAAMQAIIVTTFGGLAMLGGIVILGQIDGGSYSLRELVANPIDTSAGPLLPVALICVLVGALSKSALVPFHFWLPGAMAAPTPVSAYLHAAAMVKAGVYLVARLAPGYAEVPAWRWTVLVSAGITMILGGYRALRQHDLKLVLAFGTVSQLGFLILLVGQPDQGVALAGLALVGAHAMFKAALFLTVGVVDAATGTRDLRELSGLHRNLRWAFIPALLATASMVGIPPAAGYVGKEAVLASLRTDDLASTVILVVVVVGSILTFAYGARFLWGAFGTKKGVEDRPVDREAAGLFVSPNVLAVLGVLAGVFPLAGERLLLPYAETYPTGEPGHLALWAGWGLPVLLTVVIIGAGTGLFLLRERVERLQGRAPKLPDMDQVYRSTMRRLDRVAVVVTSRTQRGSLPLYLAVILVVMVISATTAMVVGGVSVASWRWWDTPAQLVVGAIIVVGAVLTARARRRLKSAILAGITGYGVVMLFAIHGAPDLALTQALVETVIIVIFVLVLRRLPAYYSNRPLAADRWWRIVLAVAVALTVMALALVAPGYRVDEPIWVLFPEEAYVFGYGKNVVNVTLVDIRAWDTMGEISVLLAAATGVASLIFLRTRSGSVLRARDADHSSVWAEDAHDPLAALRGTRSATPSSGRGRQWLSGGETLAPQRRSVILEVTTRLVFHSMLLYSLFLLFSGHNAPGGGFAAGIVAGTGLVIRYLAGGRYELGEAAPVLPGALLGTGLFLSAGGGAIPLLFGGTMLQSVVIEFTAGIFGEIKIVSTLLFDIGVFLVVVGLMLDVLRTLGAEVDRQGEAAGTSAPEIAFDSPRDTPNDIRPAVQVGSPDREGGSP